MDKLKFAVLIDSDNVSHSYINAIMDEITNIGVPTIKRIYGDWTTNEKSSWKSMLLEYALTPVQQYSYTTGKNSTDSAMIIDAMDILYTADVNGFCIVSSDSDFTRLATRLCEAGKMVIGMGEKKTPYPFVKACSQFKYLDVIVGEDKKPAVKSGAKTSKTKQDQPKAKAQEPAPKKNRTKKTDAKEEPKDTKKETAVKDAKATEVALPEEQARVESSATPLEEIEKAIYKLMESESESGLVSASKVGSILQNKFSDFDYRNYGCRSMTELLAKLGIPTVKYNDPNNNLPNAALLFIKVK